MMFWPSMLLAALASVAAVLGDECKASALHCSSNLQDNDLVLRLLCNGGEGGIEVNAVISKVSEYHSAASYRNSIVGNLKALQGTLQLMESLT